MELPNPLFSFGFQLPFSLALKRPNTRHQPQLLFCAGPEQWPLPHPWQVLLTVRVLGAQPQSAGSMIKQLPRQGREEASATRKFHSVCFFCSIDWKDYDDRAPRHKGQSEVLEGLLQQVRALHQHYSCRGKDKNLLRAID